MGALASILSSAATLRGARSALFLLAGLAAAAALGCATRERRNPFDPANPSTGGAPQGFRTLAGDGLVTLVWTPTDAPDLLGYQVFRRIPGSNNYQPLSGTIPTSAGTYTDLGLANGVDHTYRLYFVFDRGLGSLYAEGTGTPGPIRPYVTEFLGMTRARLTPDGRYVASRATGFQGPNDVAVDGLSHLVWTTDTYGGSVEVFDPGIGQATDFTGFAEPGAVAVDAANGTAWICDPGQDAVLHYTPSGPDVDQIVGAIDNPLGIDVEPSTRVVWVCERDGNRARTFLPDGTPQWAATVRSPSRVAVDSLTRNGWVTSFTARSVYTISPSGTVVDSFTSLSGPIGVEVDSRRGRIWVADAAAGALVALDRTALLEFRVTGLSQVREVDVDLRTGNAWATVPGAGEVVVVSPTGSILRRIGGLVDPTSVAIDPGP
jgi:hypothetical protein